WRPVIVQYIVRLAHLRARRVPDEVLCSRKRRSRRSRQGWAAGCRRGGTRLLRAAASGPQLLQAVTEGLPVLLDAELDHLAPVADFAEVPVDALDERRTAVAQLLRHRERGDWMAVVERLEARSTVGVPKGM